MIENMSVLIAEAGKSRIIHPDRPDLLHHRVNRNIHPQHADQRAHIINRHQVGADPYLIQEMRCVRAYPGWPAALDRGVIPGGMLLILRIQCPGIKGLTLGKPRFPDPGIEEAVYILTDFRINAVIISNAAMRVACDTLEGIPDLAAVRRKVSI